MSVVCIAFVAVIAVRFGSARGPSVSFVFRSAQHIRIAYIYICISFHVETIISWVFIFDVRSKSCTKSDGITGFMDDDDDCL